MLHIFIQGLVGIVAPVFCQKMIVKYIHNYSAVMAVIFVEPRRTLVDDRVGICKTVNIPMQQNSFCNLWRKFFVAFSFDSISNKIADYYAFLVAGKIDVGQKIHSINICIFGL